MFRLDPADADQAKALERLSTNTVMWLTTVSPELQPQPSAVWFWWDGETILVYSRETARLRNISANPRVSLNFDSERDGDDLSIFYGLAGVDAEGPPAKDVAGYRARYAERVPLLGMNWDTFSASYHVPLRIRLTGYRRW